MTNWDKQFTRISPKLKEAMSPIVSFPAMLQQHGLPPLRRPAVTTLQVNVGKVCNQACHHCHVEAGPKRTEIMTEATVGRVLELLNHSDGVHTVDITGGAPELNPSFRRLVEASRKMDRHVIDRCNLTILMEPGFEDLASFLASNGVHVIASLPCYTRENVDEQRGRGVFDKSIKALQLLNRLGYGRAKTELTLDLVYNPLGASLPSSQQSLESDYKHRLRSDFRIEFNNLFTITNMPICRFAEQLVRIGKRDSYEKLLIEKFNPETVERLMCRSQINIAWDGKLYDCDFNQMLELPIASASTIWDIISFDAVPSQRIVTGMHCFGCTAGPGSSCGGSLTQ